MKKASNFAYLQKKSKPASQPAPQAPVNHNALFGQQQESAPAALLMPHVLPKQEEADLNVFVLSFDGMKEAEKNLAGGDPYECKKCSAILNKFSIVVPANQAPAKFELKPHESLW